MLTTILLDVDNTLLDFNACALASMKDAFAYFHLPFSKDTVFPVFLEINSKLWTQIEDGVLTKEQHYQIRWKTILQVLGIPFDGVTLEKKFVECLHEYAIPVEGAGELLEYLKLYTCNGFRENLLSSYTTVVTSFKFKSVKQCGSMMARSSCENLLPQYLGFIHMPSSPVCDPIFILLKPMLPMTLFSFLYTTA